MVFPMSSFHSLLPSDVLTRETTASVDRVLARTFWGAIGDVSLAQVIPLAPRAQHAPRFSPVPGGTAHVRAQELPDLRRFHA